MNGSICLVTGTLGGGKTLLAVEEIFAHVMRGGFVYTNIALRFEAFAELCRKRGVIFDPNRVKIIEAKSLTSFQTQIGRGTHDMPVLVVIDEAGLEINSRDWKSMTREFLNLNVLIRKLDIRMIYIAQKAAMLDKQVRELCQTQIDCRNMKNFRLFGVFPLPIPIRVRVHHDCTWGKPNKTHTDTAWGKSWAYPLYDSDALIGEAASKFAALEQHTATALQRIEKPFQTSWLFPSFVAASVALFVSL
jgi:hypothetical protein